MKLLKQLKQYSKIMVETNSLEAIKVFKPFDATINSALIYNSIINSKYSVLLDIAVDCAKKETNNRQALVDFAVDKLTVDFVVEVAKIVAGKVSVELDARLWDNTDAIINKARSIILMFRDAGVDKERLLIKIGATWQGIKAAEQLNTEGIHCNLTLIFSLPQAIACAQAGVNLVSLCVGGKYCCSFKNNDNTSVHRDDKAGVELVKNIYNYYKKFDYSTEIMVGGFENIGEITALVGCDSMLIHRKILSEFIHADGNIERILFVEQAKNSVFVDDKIDIDTFGFLLNHDANVTEMLAEGICMATDDLFKLETLVLNQL